MLRAEGAAETGEQGGEEDIGYKGHCWDTLVSHL